MFTETKPLFIDLLTNGMRVRGIYNTESLHSFIEFMCSYFHETIYYCLQEHPSLMLETKRDNVVFAMEITSEYDYCDLMMFSLPISAGGHPISSMKESGAAALEAFNAIASWNVLHSKNMEDEIPPEDTSPSDPKPNNKPKASDSDFDWI